MKMLKKKKLFPLRYSLHAWCYMTASLNFIKFSSRKLCNLTLMNSPRKLTRSKNSFSPLNRLLFMDNPNCWGKCEGSQQSKTVSESISHRFGTIWCELLTWSQKEVDSLGSSAWRRHQYLLIHKCTYPHTYISSSKQLAMIHSIDHKL